MRQLTVKQKKLLDRVWKQSRGEARDWDSLAMNVIDELREINDTEILYNEVNRYLADKV